MSPAPRTLFEKIWSRHVVTEGAGEVSLLYVDRLLMHDGAVAHLRPPPEGRTRACAARMPSPPPPTTTCPPRRARRHRGRRGPRHGGGDGAPHRGARDPVLPARRRPSGHRARHRAPSRASPCRASRSSAATPTPPPTAPSAPRLRHRLLARSSTCWPPSASGRRSRARCASASRARLGPGVAAKDVILAIIARISAGGGTGHAHRVRGPGHRRDVHGRADDGLQHVHRGGRARGHGGARRAHLRATSRAGPSRPRARAGTAALADWKTLPTDAGRRLRRAR